MSNMSDYRSYSTQKIILESFDYFNIVSKKQEYIQSATVSKNNNKKEKIYPQRNIFDVFTRHSEEGAPVPYIYCGLLWS